MAKRNKNLVRGPQGSVPTTDDAFRNKGPSTAQTAVPGLRTHRAVPV